MLRRIHDPERGASILEYAAVMTLVAAIAGVLFAGGVAEAVWNGMDDSVALALGGEGAPDGEGDPGQEDGPAGSERGERGGRGGGAPRGIPKEAVGGWIPTGGQVGDYYADLLWNHPRENLAGTIESVLDPLGTMDAMVDGVVDTAVTMRDEYAENGRAALDQLLSGDVFGGIGTYVGGSLRITVWDNPYNGVAIARDLWGNAGGHVENGEYGRAAADVASEVLAWVGPGRVGRVLDILKRAPDAPSAPDRPGSHPQAGADDPPDTTGRDEEGATENRPEEDENPGVSCPVGANSFVPGTLVLMADGGYRAIEGIDAGERVWAFDPATGEEGPRAVTGLITGGGAKTLVDITVTDDTGETGTVTATDEHPFWAVERAEWVAAVALEPGEWLRTSAGTWTQASAVKTRAVPDQQVHNLTVEDLHTYYVAVGETGVLVHNQDDCIPGPPRVIDDHGLRHSFDRHANEWFGGNPARSTHGDQWREVIEMGMRSKKVVEWQSGSTPTYGHLVRADGKYFFVQFSRESGSLVTAFRPSGRQLSVILEKLGKQ